MHANGHMNDAAGADLEGLDRFKARKPAVEKLTELGALERKSLTKTMSVSANAPMCRLSRA